MKERPIIFNSAMVKAILDGRKTQTRRIIKPQPILLKDWSAKGFDGLNFGKFTIAKSLVATAKDWEGCPYGVVGDRLWVREAFCKSPDGIIYRATEEESGCYQPDDECVWKPSIHMPRWASRINLDIVDVRVERLNDISDKDAKAEGVNPECGHYYYKFGPGWDTTSHIKSFVKLWESINGINSWYENPWVWVIEFRKV